MEWTKFWLH
jgi:hypothetical protein